MPKPPQNSLFFIHVVAIRIYYPFFLNNIFINQTKNKNEKPLIILNVFNEKLLYEYINIRINKQRQITKVTMYIFLFIFLFYYKKGCFKTCDNTLKQPLDKLFKV